MYHIILCVCTHKDLQLLVTCILFTSINSEEIEIIIIIL